MKEKVFTGGARCNGMFPHVKIPLCPILPKKHRGVQCTRFCPISPYFELYLPRLGCFPAFLTTRRIFCSSPALQGSGAPPLFRVLNFAMTAIVLCVQKQQRSRVMGQASTSSTCCYFSFIWLWFSPCKIKLFFLVRTLLSPFFVFVVVIAVCIDSYCTGDNS